MHCRAVLSLLEAALPSAKHLPFSSHLLRSPGEKSGHKIGQFRKPMRLYTPVAKVLLSVTCGKKARPGVPFGRYKPFLRIRVLWPDLDGRHAGSTLC